MIPWFLFDAAPWAASVGAGSWAAKTKIQATAWHSAGFSPFQLSAPPAILLALIALILMPIAWTLAPMVALPVLGQAETKVALRMPDGSFWLGENRQGGWQVIIGASKNTNHIEAAIANGQRLPLAFLKADRPTNVQFESVSLPLKAVPLDIALSSPDRSRRIEAWLRLENLMALPLLTLIAAIVGTRVASSGQGAMAGVAIGLSHALLREIGRLSC
jgi:lipopolysaccharide export LptBFGC system permease protein LptF